MGKRRQNAFEQGGDDEAPVSEPKTTEFEVSEATLADFATWFYSGDAIVTPTSLRTHIAGWLAAHGHPSR